MSISDSTTGLIKIGYRAIGKSLTGKSVRMSLGVVGLIVAAFCCGCRSTQERTILDRLRASERENDWHILVSERGVYVLDLNRSALVPIYPDTGGPSGAFVGMASVSPDGSKIAFSESADLRSYSLAILDLRTGQRTIAVQLPYLQGPRWSPKGDSIAFEGTKTNTTGPSSLYLYMFGVEGLSLIVDADVKNGDSLFSWSPDGHSIVYQSFDNRIRTVDVESKAVKTIDAGWFPTWSPDGRYISYRSGEKEYSVYDLQTNQKRLILKGDSVGRSLVWSPDSRYLVYSKMGGDLRSRVRDALSISDTYGDLYVMDLRSEVQARLPTTATTICRGCSVRPIVSSR